MEEKTIKIELTPQELYQLTLCVGHRISGVTQMFVNATSQEMAKGCAEINAFLEKLQIKLQSSLKTVGEKDADTTRKEKN